MQADTALVVNPLLVINYHKKWYCWLRALGWLKKRELTKLEEARWWPISRSLGVYSA